ncbi:MAG TPA: segregation/condensation protein A [Gemmatimonadaceae bacterium]|nr:segregation/condensation protein A [Gemmatimonadaceae bacterium]
MSPTLERLTQPSQSLLADASLGSFVVELDHFSGPLDLLLTLIREEQVEITDIPVARIAQQFLARIHALGLGEAAEYLEMAARLLRIKAQMLLPRPDTGEEWDDPRAELVRRLLEYQQMREVVDVLEARGEERRNRFSRGYLPLEPEQPPARLALALPDLLAAVDRVLRLTQRPAVHDVIPRPLDVDGAIAFIRAVIAQRTHARWRDVVPRQAQPWQVISALLALLELARRGELHVIQTRPFGSVEIIRDAASEAA